MTRILHESGTITVDPNDGSFEVTLISEGEGSSARYPASFFTEENASRLAESLSFPGHPINVERPEQRDPMTAIGSIDKVVRIITEADGRKAFKSRFHPAKSKPEVGPYLKEFGSRLALSIYSDSDGHEAPDGKWVAESLAEVDPYRSVDIVIAGGARGRFEKLSESLGLLGKTSKPSGGSEEEEKNMEIEKAVEALQKGQAELTTLVENLVKTLTENAQKGAQVEADAAAVEKTVEARVAAYDKAVGLLSEAKLTESMDAELREAARKGEDIAPRIETAKKVLAEARAGYVPENPSDDDIVTHLGGGQRVTESATPSGFNPSVPGFGKVN